MLYKLKIFIVTFAIFALAGCSNMTGLNLKLGMLLPGAQLTIDFSNANHSMCINIDDENRALVADVVSGVVTGAELANRTARLKYLSLVNNGKVNAQGQHVVCVDIAAVSNDDTGAVAQQIIAGVLANPTIAEDVASLKVRISSTHHVVVKDSMQLAQVFEDNSDMVKNFD